MADILVDASSVDGRVTDKKLPVKWMNNKFQGSYQKPNPYNETYICEILDRVLVHGYNEQTISSVEYVEGHLKFNLTDSVSKFEKYSVVDIKGSAYSEFDDEYRVADSSEGWFTIEYPNDISTLINVTETKIKYAPLGWELAYSSGTRRIYRSPNINSPRPYVIFEGNRYKTGNKGEYFFVAMSDKMVDIDTKSPDAFTVPRVTDSKLNLHSGGTGAVHMGIIRVYNNIYSNTLFSNNVGYYNTPYTIIGDDRTFIISFNGNSAQNGYNTYTSTFIGDIDPVSSWDKGCTALGGIRHTLASVKSGAGLPNDTVGNVLYLFSPTVSENLEFLIDHQGYGTRNSFGKLLGENLSPAWHFYSGGIYSNYNENTSYIFANPSAYGNLSFISKSMKYVSDTSPVVGNSVRGVIPYIYWIQSRLSGISNDIGVIIDNLRGDDTIYYQLYTNGVFSTSLDENSNTYVEYRLFMPIDKWR